MHHPERREGESQKEYRERQARARADVRRILAGTLIDPRKLGKGPSSTDRERACVRAERPQPTQPKFKPERTRRPHQPVLHDEHGAYTLTGREYFPDGSQRRRMWLAGVSAQRGY